MKGFLYGIKILAYVSFVFFHNYSRVWQTDGRTGGRTIHSSVRPPCKDASR